MPTDTTQILDAAEKLGQLVGQHPAVERYKQAQEALSKDPDAARLMNDFNRQLMTLARQEESGMPVTDAQRHQLEALQGQLAAHLKVKALTLAQVEYVNLMRQVSDKIRQYAGDGAQGGGGAGGGAGGAGGGAGGGGMKVVL
jgi:cell fate (sporulation/competence/biofilm development) regulator YlbF (YheA/YmcA/DUF963 family)